MADDSDLQAANRLTAHLDPGPGIQVESAINKYARAICTHGIAAAIHWVPVYHGIPGNKEADRQGNKVREDRDCTRRELISTSAWN